MNPRKFYTMKKLFTLILILSTTTGFAQSYYNEWINPSLTYYKFKVATEGLYRIPQSSLAAIGLNGVPAQQFKLWRNGQEVKVYTSVASGALPANGYIEFWGEPNDGKPDRPMYLNPIFQHRDKLSLQTDTAAYYLTVSGASPNLRMTDVANNVAGNVLPAEPYFMYTKGNYFKSQINYGFAAVVGEYVYSSAYDKGEFWSSPTFAPRDSTTGVPNSLLSQANSLFPYTAGPAATFTFGAVGNALNTRSIQVKINNTAVIDTVCDFFNDVVASTNFSPTLLNGGTADLEFINTSGTQTDRTVASFYEITYPRLFNFGGAANFKFTLPANPAGYFLQITNFNPSSTQPVLYDFTNGERFIGDITSPGLVRFALPAKAQERQLVLASQAASNYTVIDGSAFRTKNFIDFNDVNNQGNYLIITSPLLYTGGTNGVNPIDEYKKYRSSAVGGGYNVKVVEIDELVDQFAFGIKKHPLSIKNFLRFAKAKFAGPPQYALLIGHGITYDAYLVTQYTPESERLNMIPTFGWPASDNMLATADGQSSIPQIPIGRLSVVSAVEIEHYLEKVKEYESAQKNSPNTIAGRAWMKNIIHVTGASDSYLGTVLCSYMESYKQIVEDTLIGGNVTVFCKNSADPNEQLSNDRIGQLFEEGLSMVTYFGHSSSTTLEFNLDNPSAYNNPGKYPIFSVNGCNAGNFYLYDPQRFTFNETLSEKFTLAKQRGGVAFIASTHFGIVNYLNIYLNSMYTLMGKSDYGAPLGKLHRDACERMMQIAGFSDFYARLNAEELTLHGDPALQFNFGKLPDYVLEKPQVRISPQFISIASDNFTANVKIYNIGRAIDDSITLKIEQKYPDGSTAIIFTKRMKGIHFTDSLSVTIPIVGTRDKGQNFLTLTIDADGEIAEQDESNNTITTDFFIYEDEAKPAYPYDYSIISQQNQKLYASTANPFSNLKTYTMEMDTTTAFNSPAKVTKTITSVGGVLEFDPGVTLKDSTVYYWRTSFVPAAGGEYRWNLSSFIFLNGSSSGFNQSHYFQHTASKAEKMSLATDRNWKFGAVINNLFVRNGIFGTSAFSANDLSVSVNGEITAVRSACLGHSIVFNVFHPVTFKPWLNVDENGQNLHLYGSADANCAEDRYHNFEFSYMDPTARKAAMDFMDAIPNGYFVVARSFDYDNTNSYSSTWRADTLLYGSNNSLYHKLAQAGFANIDSVNAPKSWGFVYKKGEPTFTPKSQVSTGLFDRVQFPIDCLTPDSIGYITSPAFGPAKAWKQVHWRGESMEATPGDNPSVTVIGVAAGGLETPLFNMDKGTQDYDISSISAAQYPYIKLKMRNTDSISLTPYQLRYWRLDYDAIPEGALIPNIYFKSKDPAKSVDSLDIGEPLNFGIAFKNISGVAFDSLRLKMYILDNGFQNHPVILPKRKPLIAGDSVRFDYTIETKDYPGMNTLYIDFNPDGDQPEQFHFNNFLFRNFYVRPDKTNPLLDVTFDNVHILNKDIVSAKPHIQIKLKDEAKFLLLNDTGDIVVQVRFPGNTIRTFHFGTDTLKFTPASSGADNTASIDFYPQFLDQINPEGDEYELIVSGKDRSDNKAGTTQYKVIFRVIGKPMISNLLNYPNPFTTSTAFVFTITGSEIPQNMKIQILTVTGKIVREITKEELGPLHIGRNITEYKWDGTDQFGQRLGNGVYLYRFVTQLNGIKMDKYKAEGDNTDKYFKGGYGKMYLMR
jgi:hypothetical protein